MLLLIQWHQNLRQVAVIIESKEGREGERSMEERSMGEREGGEEKEMGSGVKE